MMFRVAIALASGVALAAATHPVSDGALRAILIATAAMLFVSGCWLISETT